MNQKLSTRARLNIMTKIHFLQQPDSQGLHLRYLHYGEDPDTGWSRHVAPKFWVLEIRT